LLPHRDFSCSFQDEVGSISRNYPLAYLTISTGWLSFGEKTSSCCKCMYCPEYWCCHSYMFQLTAPSMLTNMHWEMQDGAIPHRANIILNFLHDTFGSSVISGWYPNSHVHWVVIIKWFSGLNAA
jgi:hypothetical protein